MKTYTWKELVEDENWEHHLNDGFVKVEDEIQRFNDAINHLSDKTCLFDEHDKNIIRYSLIIMRDELSQSNPKCEFIGDLCTTHSCEHPKSQSNPSTHESTLEEKSKATSKDIGGQVREPDKSQSNLADEHLPLPVQPVLPKVLSRPEYSQSNPTTEAHSLVSNTDNGNDKLSNPLNDEDPRSTSDKGRDTLIYCPRCKKDVIPNITTIQKVCPKCGNTLELMKKELI